MNKFLWNILGLITAIIFLFCYKLIGAYIGSGFITWLLFCGILLVVFLITADTPEKKKKRINAIKEKRRKRSLEQEEISKENQKSLKNRRIEYAKQEIKKIDFLIKDLNQSRDDYEEKLAQLLKRKENIENSIK